MKFGVDTFIWTEAFGEKDLWVIRKAEEMGFEAIDFAIARPETFPTELAAAELSKTRLTPVTSTTLNAENSLISADADARDKGVSTLKRLIDINRAIGSNILGGVSYAGWGCLTGKPKTDIEWTRSVEAMRRAAEYALKMHPRLKICVEPVNRFETHLINTAEEGVRYVKAVGTGNMAVHLDSFHMIREETDFAEAVRTCGKAYLGYVHVCENNRGIPGSGLVPWEAFFSTLEEVGYQGPCVIESFDPSFEELNANCAIWRKFADTGEELAARGLENLRKIVLAIKK